MTSGRREQIYAFVCAFFDANGYAPTSEEIAKHFKISTVGTWKHVKGLLADGRLHRTRERERYLTIPGRFDLRPVPTDALVAELARRRAVGHAHGALR